MRVFFDSNCQAHHARDKYGTVYNPNQSGGVPQPPSSAHLLHTLEIFAGSDCLWFEVGTGTNPWHCLPSQAGRLIKIHFNGGTGRAVKAQAHMGTPIEDGTPGSGKPGGKQPCNSFEIWHGELPNPGPCCWIKLGGQWYCLAC
jgi:hypothetical protein